MGVVHDVVQGEGGEQGDPLMPALFALGQHRALVAVRERLRPDEHLLAFLDDVYIVCRPDRVVHIHAMLRLSCGTTRASRSTRAKHRFGTAVVSNRRTFNSSSRMPLSLTQTRLFREETRILGTPLGHSDFVQRHLQS